MTQACCSTRSPNPARPNALPPSSNACAIHFPRPPHLPNRMQTFDVLSPAPHSIPTRNTPVNFPGEKPAQNGEKFGDVMDRALNGPPREWNANDQSPKAAVKPPVQ